MLLLSLSVVDGADHDEAATATATTDSTATASRSAAPYPGTYASPDASHDGTSLAMAGVARARWIIWLGCAPRSMTKTSPSSRTAVTPNGTHDDAGAKPTLGSLLLYTSELWPPPRATRCTNVPSAAAMHTKSPRPRPAGSSATSRTSPSDATTTPWPSTRTRLRGSSTNQQQVVVVGGGVDVGGASAAAASSE